MKTLTLLRHAKTERVSPDGGDFNRSLDDRGRADAKRIGREIRRLGMRFDLVLASPARRVVETVEGVGELSPLFERRIYEASTSELLDIVRDVDDGVERLLLVGHNPGLEQLAARLTVDQVADFPTAALTEIDLPIETWIEAGTVGGIMRQFVRPRDLDR